MNAKPFGQSYTTTNPKHQRMKLEIQNKREKARTICEITESVASTILQFFGSRNWQRYNDGETQPESTQNSSRRRRSEIEKTHKIFRVTYTFCSRAKILVPRQQTTA